MTFDLLARRHTLVATSGKIVWAGRIVSALMGLLFLLSAFMKIKGGPEVAEGIRHLGLPESMLVPLSILEAACAVIYLIPSTAVVGAILLTGYIGGAMCTHWRVGDPFYLHIVLGILVWLALYVREGRLKALIPLRKAWLSNRVLPVRPIR
jgi:DoxX-like family